MANLGGGVRDARPERLRALTASELTIAGEAVAVAGEEVGHLFLPGIDEPDLFVVRHRTHVEQQADVLARLVVEAEKLEDLLVVCGASHASLLHDESC